MLSKYFAMARQFDWQVTVFNDDKMRNAFALPGGKIAIYTGIFPVAKNEAALGASVEERWRSANSTVGSSRRR